MRAILIDRPGGPEMLRLGETRTPVAGPGEVLVEIGFAGVNPADWKCRQGMLEAFFTPAYPFILGFDLAGVVAAIGPGVAGLVPGDRVFGGSQQGSGRNGAYAEYAATLPAFLAPVPEGMMLAEAAAYPTAALTAWQALFTAGALQRGQTVLIHGGSGGVGSFAVQLAKAAGATVIASCGAANLDYVTGLGADHAVDYRAADVAAAALALAPGGVDLAVDAVGCGTLPGALTAIRPGGSHVAIPTLLNDPAAPDPAEAARRGIRLVAAVYADLSQAPDQLVRIGALWRSGRLKTPRLKVMPWADVAAAHREVETGHAGGKIVLEIGGEEVG